MFSSVNRSYGIVSVFVFILFALHTNNALGGWSTTAWGMTIEQVRAKVKENIKEIPKQERGQYSRKDYSHFVSSYVIGKYSYKVLLSFGKNGLDEVLLTLEKGQDPHASFLYLEDELKKKYGPPSTSSNNKKMAIGIEDQHRGWITKDTSIKLYYSSAPFMSVIYEPRRGDAGNRL